MTLDPEDDENCKDMVEEMLNECTNLTDWEINFLDSVYEQNTFSEKQKDCIEKIYKRRM